MNVLTPDENTLIGSLVRDMVPIGSYVVFSGVKDYDKFKDVMETLNAFNIELPSGVFSGCMSGAGFLIVKVESTTIGRSIEKRLCDKNKNVDVKIWLNGQLFKDTGKISVF